MHFGLEKTHRRSNFILSKRIFQRTVNIFPMEIKG